MKPFSKILVPIDFSSHADEAVAAAIDVAKRYDASITLVNVYQPVAYAFPEGFGLYTATQLADLLTDLTKLLNEAKQKAEQAGAKRIDAVQRQGFPATEIVDLARSGGYDLVVMGTHGRTGIAHALMGSVAERVLRTAPCPVLTVKSDDAAKA